jgi:putative Mg2+ transporter-C (MgtC) family protein
MDSWFYDVASWVPLVTISRLLVAIATGAIVGWEREARNKPAGLRTHILVSLGAAVFMVTAVEFVAGFDQQSPEAAAAPIRALQGIVGGVGFLGAGSIVQSRGSVRGITTAASIWVAAAMGAACGMGLFRVAISCGLLSLTVLWALGSIEQAVLGKPDEEEEAQEVGEV